MWIDRITIGFIPPYGVEYSDAYSNTYMYVSLSLSLPVSLCLLFFIIYLVFVFWLDRPVYVFHVATGTRTMHNMK